MDTQDHAALSEWEREQQDLKDLQAIHDALVTSMRELLKAIETLIASEEAPLRSRIEA